MSVLAVNPTESIEWALCDECRETVRVYSEPEGQIWVCMGCGRVRAWGFGPPWDRDFRPALRCSNCSAVTRHGFVCVR